MKTVFAPTRRETPNNTKRIKNDTREQQRRRGQVKAGNVNSDKF